MSHVTGADVEKLLSGRLEDAEARSVLRHLLACCPDCLPHLERVAEALDEDEPAEPGLPIEDPGYDAAFDRAFAAARAALPHWREEAARTARNLAEAPRHPHGVLGLPRETPDEFRWSWVETLLRTVPAERYRDPQKMYLLALAAEGQARRLRESGLYPPALAADLHARALCELANAARVNEDLDTANRLLNEAARAQREGTCDPLLLARIGEIGASLRKDQRRLDVAVEALDTAGRLYREAGETHLAGRVLITKGICTAHLGCSKEAAEILQEGLAAIDPARDPQLAVSGRYNYIHSLADCAQYRKASRFLLESGLGEAFAAEPLNLLKLRWLEGRIHAGLGRLEKAEAALAAARAGFFEKNQHYDAALAGLDLLGVWLRQDRAAEARALAEDVLETFNDLGIQSEALKALRYLREACRRQAATPALVQTVAGFLRQLSWQPLLRFAP